MLQDHDVIREGDEASNLDGDWRSVSRSNIGKRYGDHHFIPMRRLLTDPPHIDISPLELLLEKTQGDLLCSNYQGIHSVLSTYIERAVDNISDALKLIRNE
jgi:hypothetical protein